MRAKKYEKTTKKHKKHKKHTRNINKTRKYKKLNGGGPYEDDVKKQFNTEGIRFDGKRCLDIGSRDGLNCITLVELGAKEVVGIDIDDSRFHEMPRNERITLIKQDLLTYDDDERFDVITCFLWNMYLPQYTSIMNKIKSLLKPDGVVYIGIHDDLYKYDEYGGSVPQLLNNNFKSVRILNTSSPYQWILEAKKPILTI